MLENYPCTQIAQLASVTGITPVLQIRHTQHDPGHFNIALALAEYVSAE